MTQATHQLAYLSAKPPTLLASLDSAHFSFAILTHRTMHTAPSVSQRENAHNLKVYGLGYVGFGDVS